jgi:hypothetical protein
MWYDSSILIMLPLGKKENEDTRTAISGALYSFP